MGVLKHISHLYFSQIKQFNMGVTSSIQLANKFFKINCTSLFCNYSYIHGTVKEDHMLDAYNF